MPKKKIRPTDFPYAEAHRIYREAVKEFGPQALPMSEAEFRATLDPVAIVNNCATVGGPQPAEMDRMLAGSNAKLAQQEAYVKQTRSQIAASLAKLDHDLDRLLPAAK